MYQSCWMQQNQLLQVTDKGYATGLRNIYHYVLKDGQFVKELCQTCTFSNEWCSARREAEELIVPEGDK